MPPTQSLGVTAKIFIAVVTLTGLVIFGQSLYHLLLQPPPLGWLVLTAMAIVGGAFNIKVPSLPARLSVSEAFVFAMVPLYGSAAATIAATLDALVMSLRLRTDKKSRYRAPFNVASATLSLSASTKVYSFLLSVDLGAQAPLFSEILLPLLALAVACFLLNSALIALAMSLERDVPVFPLWRNHFMWLGLNNIGGASLASLIVAYNRQSDLSIIGVVIPLVGIMYLTFRTSLGRLEDANQHVNQLNELYLSTIETLAMAVDAKDQITHGHIRRVQVYAVELARRLGVSDSTQLRAIEAAALLHDMGKLAIPEHILNKPGSLSGPEFDTMKQHVDIGANLVSTIRFPYPVVPIVRHHHERWDGKGYPSGISGVDIPLGARILSVVDCFDALTSDRPYRRRLTTQRAFETLLERRNSMYDPLVVDTFIAIHHEIEPLAHAAAQDITASLLSTIPAAGGRTPSLATTFRTTP